MEHNYELFSVHVMFVFSIYFNVKSATYVKHKLPVFLLV